jgi:transposase
MPKKSGEQAIGRSRGGPSTKLQVVVDALGNPTRMVLTPGQTHEMRVADERLGDIQSAYVIADSAYSAKGLADALVARGCTVVIPSNPTHPQRHYDAHPYKDRHLIENFFQRIKRFRRIAMRFEKLARNFLAFLFFAASLVWLR